MQIIITPNATFDRGQLHDLRLRPHNGLVASQRHSERQLVVTGDFVVVTNGLSHGKESHRLRFETESDRPRNGDSGGQRRHGGRRQLAQPTLHSLRGVLPKN